MSIISGARESWVEGRIPQLESATLSLSSFIPPNLLLFKHRVLFIDI